MRIMALDVGDSRIGVALSDPMQVLASPLTIVERLNEASDVSNIAKLIDEHAAARLVIGLPLSLSGETGMQAEKVKVFADGLKEAVGIPIEMIDERFSTVTAKEYMREAGGKRNITASSTTTPWPPPSFCSHIWMSVAPLLPRLLTDHNSSGGRFVYSASSYPKTAFLVYIISLLWRFRERYVII